MSHIHSDPDQDSRVSRTPWRACWSVLNGWDGVLKDNQYLSISLLTEGKGIEYTHNIPQHSVGARQTRTYA